LRGKGALLGALPEAVLEVVGRATASERGGVLVRASMQVTGPSWSESGLPAGRPPV